VAAVHWPLVPQLCQTLRTIIISRVHDPSAHSAVTSFRFIKSTNFHSTMCEIWHQQVVQALLPTTDEVRPHTDLLIKLMLYIPLNTRKVISQMFFPANHLARYWRNWTYHTTTPHHNRFTALFLGPPGWAGVRENFWTLWCKGRLTEEEAGRHSIQINQCPPPPPPEPNTTTKKYYNTK